MTLAEARLGNRMLDSHIYSPVTTRGFMISCQVCWRNDEMAQRSNPALSKPELGRSLPDCLTKWEKSAAHSILARSEPLQQRPYTFAQTNLSLSLFACDKAADHTFRVADDSLGTDSKIHGIPGRSLLKQFESLDYVYNPIK